MKKGLTLFLQLVIVALGIGALAVLLWEPHLEGVNAHSAFFAVYLDPFIALVYIGSIPFFVALYQALKILGYAGQNRIFSHATAQALQNIKYSALTIIAFVAVEEIFIMLNHGSDDPAGGVAMGVFITVGSIVVATVATVLERRLQCAVDLKN